MTSADGSMKQVAPEPSELRALVEALTYKAGWEFRLDDDLDRGQGSRGTTLVITLTMPDSYDTDRLIRVNHYMPVPPAAFNRSSWTRWLFDQIMLVETHEAMEFFKLADSRPYAPNHAPGNDPYTVREVIDLKDAQTNHLGIHRDVKV